MYPVDQQLHFAHGRLRLKFLLQIWQRSDLGSSILIEFGAQNFSEESAHRRIDATGMLYWIVSGTRGVPLSTVPLPKNDL